MREKKPAVVAIKFLLVLISIVFAIAGRDLQGASATPIADTKDAERRPVKISRNGNSPQNWKSRNCPYTIEVITGKPQDGHKVIQFKDTAKKVKDTKAASITESTVFEVETAKPSRKAKGPLKLITRAITEIPDNSGYWPVCLPIASVSCKFDFSNALKDTGDLKSMIEVVPPVERLAVLQIGSGLFISGSFKPNCTYKIVFSNNITDIYGQKLARDASASIVTSSLKPSIEQPVFETRAPNEELMHVIWAQGAPTLHVSIRRVQADDWKECASHAEDWPTLGELVSERDYSIGSEGRRVEIDMKPYLRNGFGHFLISADLRGHSDSFSTHRDCWFEVTDIALDAFDAGRIEFLTSRLSDGKPFEGVEIKSSTLGTSVVSDKDGRAAAEYKKVPLISNWVARKRRR